MQKAKADDANEKYNKKKELEYEIKQLEQDKSQKETEKKDFESKIAYYESQINQLHATSDKTQKEALQKKIHEVTTSLTDIGFEIDAITTRIEKKREKLRNLQS
jgi:chromosome segregation ATPase